MVRIIRKNLWCNLLPWRLQTPFWFLIFSRALPGQFQPSTFWLQLAGKKSGLSPVGSETNIYNYIILSYHSHKLLGINHRTKIITESFSQCLPAILSYPTYPIPTIIPWPGGHGARARVFELLDSISPWRFSGQIDTLYYWPQEHLMTMMAKKQVFMRFINQHLTLHPWKPRGRMAIPSSTKHLKAPLQPSRWISGIHGRCYWAIWVGYPPVK